MALDVKRAHDNRFIGMNASTHDDVENVGFSGKLDVTKTIDPINKRDLIDSNKKRLHVKVILTTSGVNDHITKSGGEPHVSVGAIVADIRGNDTILNTEAPGNAAII